MLTLNKYITPVPTSQLPRKPLYTLSNNPKNTILTVTRTISGSSDVLCPDRGIRLIRQHSEVSIKETNLSLISFLRYKKGYSKYIDSINRQCNFITLKDRSPISVRCSLNTDAIQTPEDYITYWKFFSSIPTLKLVSEVSATSELSLDDYEYDFDLLPYSRELTRAFGTVSASKVTKYPYVYLIKEGYNYFIKFECRALLSSYESYHKKSIVYFTVKDYIEWDRNEIRELFGFDEYLHEFNSYVVNGVVYFDIILNLYDLNGSEESRELLLDAPILFFGESDDLRNNSVVSN